MDEHFGGRDVGDRAQLEIQRSVRHLKDEFTRAGDQTEVRVGQFRIHRRGGFQPYRHIVAYRKNFRQQPRLLEPDIPAHAEHSPDIRTQSPNREGDCVRRNGAVKCVADRTDTDRRSRRYCRGRTRVRELDEHFGGCDVSDRAQLEIQ